MNIGTAEPRLIPSSPESSIQLPRQLSIWALFSTVDDYYRSLGADVNLTASARVRDCQRLPNPWWQWQRQHPWRRPQRRNLWCR